MSERRHDHDAGGDEATLHHKATLRDRVWERMRDEGVDRFPGAQGRIPNFTGAEQAAERLRDTAEWRRAATVKANPDSPQWPVRQRALEDGKTVYMAAPRLAAEQPFLRLEPDRIEESPRRASSIEGASRNAEPVDLDDLEPVELVVVGSVAVSDDGARLGKGGGFSDLEFAVAIEAGLIDEATVIVSTVHEVQVLPAGELPMTDHDVPVDLVVTPDRVIDCRGGPHDRPDGVVWDDLTEEKIEAIPLLGRLRPG